MDEKEAKKNCCQGCWLIDAIVLAAINQEGGKKEDQQTIWRHTDDVTSARSWQTLVCVVFSFFVYVRNNK